MDYEPGRRLRTAGAARALAVVIWGAYVVAGVFALQSFHHEQRSMATVVYVAIPMLFGFVQRRVIASYNAAFKIAIAPLHQGDPLRAERQLDLLSKRFRWPRFLPRLAGYNRALALLRLGKHQEAIEQLAAVDRAGGVINVDAAIAGTLAYLHALNGNLVLAEIWFRENMSRRQRMRAAPGVFPDIMSDVAIELRRGNFRQLATRLADQWPEMEQTMNGQRLRPLRALRAFAIAQADLRDAGAATAVLAQLGGARYSELAYLGTAWPELDTFLRTNLVA
jgi:hypothetical protein